MQVYRIAYTPQFVWVNREEGGGRGGRFVESPDMTTYVLRFTFHKPNPVNFLRPPALP
jgi:hypothetical protein